MRRRCSFFRLDGRWSWAGDWRDGWIVQSRTGGQRVTVAVASGRAGDEGRFIAQTGEEVRAELYIDKRPVSFTGISGYGPGGTPTALLSDADGRLGVTVVIRLESAEGDALAPQQLPGLDAVGDLFLESVLFDTAAYEGGSK
jgi:hypothetical protein